MQRSTDSGKKSQTKCRKRLEKFHRHDRATQRTLIEERKRQTCLVPEGISV